MRNLPIHLFCLVLLTLCTYIHADEPRLVYEAEYSGDYKAFSVNVTKRLYALGNDRFLLQNTANNFFGRINEKETFTWRPSEGIRPLEYRYKQKIFGQKRIRTIQYDWQKMQALSTHKDKTNTLKLSAGTLGPMTYQLQLQLDMLNKLETFHYHFISRGKLKEYHFSPVGTQTLTLDGYFIPNALYIKRQNEGNSRETQVWLDKDKHYAIAMIKQLKEKKTENALRLKSDQYFGDLRDTPFHLMHKKKKPKLGQNTSS